MLVGIVNNGLIDWDNLQIIEIIDEEGRLQVISEEQMFDILVFKVQEERAQREKEAGTKHSACKGLEEAVKLAFYMAEQRECFKHLMYNYVKKYKGAEHIYPTGRAYKKDVHDYHMNHVYAIPKTNLYLDIYHSLK
jgi:hypothetical protein